ncbi:uncharacterized protein LOC114968109 [Acropora millepora]|uniref:uncharacterized protein LOC114968109 n=1 Tax=Acropora millepora TaxID=45264 RepID=UPI0010FC66C7|nr:uncharacterized protein LOC114968109 [Acropora millepora]
MEDQIRKEEIAFYSNDHQEDILYDFVKAKQSILDWKAHILRSCNQEKAKQDLLQNLTTSEAIVTMDWAMKFQQMNFREKQSEWFGKRGLSWQISSVIFKDENSKEIEVQSYAHLFDSCTQDWYAVVSILEDLLFKFKSTHPSSFLRCICVQMKRVVTITILSSQLYQASGKALEFRSDALIILSRNTARTFVIVFFSLGICEKKAGLVRG